MQTQAQSSTPPGKIRRWVRTELPQIALMLVLLAAARDSFANHYYVPSGSMEHTLEIGDRVAVDMRAYGVRLPFTNVQLIATGKPERGDIAVFDSPQDGIRLIKRVAAVAGDEVELVDGRLSINGVPLETIEAADIEVFRNHRAMLNLSHGGGPDIHGLTIPDGEVLMLGDARGNSIDGRFFGLVPVGELYGRAVAVYHRRGEGFAWRRL
ncbi:signal peptidase I [Pseudoxanthomonas sacheonensis]|uniref:Signal peptidase I n=1 Tax=Pseudoxanthomonas sacheonensis TaxID=443615 RepID=A0ABU1RT55_9GAMM|nr:signal peptidase I [Pseudoxanthomonas sacheonensis]MDR6841963.1 signal peptidase I [Pseudoxanthomonas sacheonensis]